VSQWPKLDEATRQAMLNPDPAIRPKAGLNDAKGDDIEWARKTHNPLTGCEHNCNYCYAFDLAEKYRDQGNERYRHGFAPTFQPDRLLVPRFHRPPKEAEHDTRHKNIFLCSMADLYGNWVYEEIVQAILRECELAPWWNFLCLTKFPKRMSEFVSEFGVPPNVWLGASVDCQSMVAETEKAFAKIQSTVRWLSCEPMLTSLEFTRLDLFDWVVIGGASKSERTPEWRPPVEWVFDLRQQVKDAGCKVFIKHNTFGMEANRPLEVPGGKLIRTGLQEAPEAFSRRRPTRRKGEAAFHDHRKGRDMKAG
jgi:protein gp37